MRVLQILPALKTGGVERGAIEIDNALVKAGYESHIIAKSGPLIDNIKGIYRPLNTASKNPWIIYKNIKKIYDYIISNKIEIAHARSRAPAWSTYYAAKAANIPFITTFHGAYNIQSKAKRYYNSIMTKGKKIIAVSEYIKNHIIENYHIESEKIVVIHRGVDKNNFELIDDDLVKKIRTSFLLKDDQKAIILPARITEWKGHIWAINSLKDIPTNKYKCFFIGEVESQAYLEKLKEVILKNDLMNNVFIYPPSYNMQETYAASDIVISPSIRPEAFGRIAIEAQIMKKPVIATRIGGACETIIDKQTGWLVELNSTDDLKSKIIDALSIDDYAYESISQNAHNNIVENFSLNKMQQKTLAIYQQVIEDYSN